MKIVIQNNEIMAIGNNDYSDYSDLSKSIRIVNDLYRYDTPIVDIDYDMSPDKIPNESEEFSEQSLEYDRYNLKVGDPDPIINTININLNNRKIIATTSIAIECENFINYNPTGVRYTQAKQSSFTDIRMHCEKWLADNPSATTEQKEPYTTRITTIDSARTWIYSVLNYYYGFVALIRAATEENWSAAINWDFSTLNASDPDVWLETVRILDSM